MVQEAAVREVGRQKSEVSDFYEPLGQHMLQEAPDEQGTGGSRRQRVAVSV